MIHNYYLSELVEVMAVNHLVAMFPFIKLGNLVDLIIGARSCPSATAAMIFSLSLPKPGD